MAKYQTTSLKT